MTEAEYELTFGEWCNTTKGTHLELTEFGSIDYRSKDKQSVTEQYHDLWMAERKEFTYRQKNQSITTALESLKKRGIPCELSNYQNGHIKAKSRRGIILSYYATTGTIAGYADTAVNGLDEFIRLCER